MPDKNYTHLIVILDRSGSMAQTLQDVIGGLNSYVDAQRAQPGRATLTLAQFDDQHDLVYSAVPLDNVAPRSVLNYVPRGSTALYDAIGRTVVAEGARLAVQPEHERPGAVLVAIVTDGDENASREWTYDQVQRLIKQQTDQWKWSFTYIGSTPNAVQIGQDLGITNSANYSSTRGAFGALAGSTSRVRSATSRGLGLEAVRKAAHYTDEEHHLMAPDTTPDPNAPSAFDSAAHDNERGRDDLFDLFEPGGVVRSVTYTHTVETTTTAVPEPSGSPPATGWGGSDVAPTPTPDPTPSSDSSGWGGSDTSSSDSGWGGSSFGGE